MESAGEIRSILIVVENLPVPFDRRVWMEATTLRDAGYNVAVISPTGKGYDKEYEIIENIHIYRHNLPPEQSSVYGYFREYSSALISEWRLANKAYKDHKFKVFHACNPPDLIFIVAVWFRLFYGVKFLFDHHDLTPELYESKFNKRGFFYQCMRWAERCTFALASKVISTNESYKKIAIERGKMKQENVQIVRSGPDLDKFKPVNINRKLFNNRKYMVGYLGVMGEFDGVDHLVRAAEILIKNGRNDIHFCLIGSGPCFEDLNKLSIDLGISEFIEFTGRISDTEMIERLSSCDICVDCDPLNPLNDKCTMNKVLEYMALGRPIVQYDLTEGRYSAQQASVYAEPNNINDLATKIEELLDNEIMRQQMSEIGLKRMTEDLEWKHQKPNLLKVYNELFS